VPVSAMMSYSTATTSDALNDRRGMMASAVRVYSPADPFPVQRHAIPCRLRQQMPAGLPPALGLSATEATELRCRFSASLGRTERCAMSRQWDGISQRQILAIPVKVVTQLAGLRNDRLLRRSGPFPGAVRSVRDFAVRHASPLSQKPSNNRSSHDGELVGIKRPGGRPLAVIGLSFRSRLHPAAWLTSRGPRCGSAVRQGFSGRRVRGDVPGAWLSECAQQSPQPSPDRNVYRDSSFSASGRSSPADDTCR
jgi:hypothetical protein